MGFQKGQPKIGGRKKGTPNKKTVELRTKLESKGHDPFLALAEIAIEARAAAAQVEGKDKLDWLKLASANNAELTQYIEPKRKAIEHSGSIGSHEESLEDLDDSPDAD